MSVLGSRFVEEKYENGNVRCCGMADRWNGQQGEWKYFTPGGVLESTTEYSKNKKLMRVLYYPSGSIKAVYFYNQESQKDVEVYW